MRQRCGGGMRLLGGVGDLCCLKIGGGVDVLKLHAHAKFRVRVIFFKHHSNRRVSMHMSTI